MDHTISDGVVFLDNSGVLVDIDEQRIIIIYVTVGSHFNVVVVHVHGRNFAAHVGSEVSLILHDMHARERVANLCRQRIERSVTVLLEIVLNGFVGWCKDGVVTVSLQNGEIVAALQDGLEVAEL